MVRLKIMSLNLRWSGAKDGINCFENRKPKIRELLSREAPDVIGFQEITPEMRHWLVETMDAYYAVGGGRGKGYSGEAPLVMFRKDCFQLISSDTVMLSATPDVPGSMYGLEDHSRCPRAYVKALLKHDELAEPFYFYNVHTDHFGANGRILASMQMMQDINSHTKKFFLTGDLNAAPDATEIRLLSLACNREILDATAGLGGTLHGFGKETLRDENGELLPGTKIDYVFVGGEASVIESRVVVEAPSDGIYSSDHFAVYAVVEL